MLPKECIEFRIALYTLKEYKGWTDAQVAKRLDVSERTVRNMRADPFSASGVNILKVQALAQEARERYGGNYE